MEDSKTAAEIGRNRGRQCALDADWRCTDHVRRIFAVLGADGAEYIRQIEAYRKEFI